MATIPNVTQIPPPRMQLIDPRTGLITREWYLWFINLYNITGGGSNPFSIEDLQLGPIADGDGFAEAIAALSDEIGSLPSFALAPAQSDPLNPVYVQTAFPDDVSPVPIPIEGASGTFTTVDLKTVTVRHGLIVSIA